MYGAPAFAKELLERLVTYGFDVAGLGKFLQPMSRRASGTPLELSITQIMGARPTPMVPVLLNTYFPPNQPTPSRCYDLGLALRRAIEASTADLRVGIVASGGLSHFVTDERLDGQVFATLRNGSEEQLRALPEHLLNAGSSEIRNWIVAAAACMHLELAWDEYIPVYRMAAGTGCGLGFACWS